MLVLCAPRIEWIIMGHQSHSTLRLLSLVVVSLLRAHQESLKIFSSHGSFRHFEDKKSEIASELENHLFIGNFNYEKCYFLPSLFHTLEVVESRIGFIFTQFQLFQNKILCVYLSVRTRVRVTERW